MKERIQNLIKLFQDKADCALITDDINRRYLTGMKSSAGYVLVFPEQSYLLIDFRYIEKARETVKHCQVIEQKGNVFRQFDELFKKHGAETIAVEAQSLTLQRCDNLKNHMKNYEFLTDNTLSQALYDLRTVKSPEEITKIKSAQKIAEDALSALLEKLHAGMTEIQVALELDFYMRSHGAEDLSFETIALTGAHTSMPHGVPDERKIQKGDFVLMDFGAVVDGYHSDMTRTVCVGQPSQEMRDVYEIVRTAQDTARVAAKAGISGKELDAVARDVITNAGYGEYFGHSLGHGVGLEIHEFPVASPNREQLLPAGGVVTIEPGIYLPGKFGVRIEDFVHITKNNCENLTNIPNSLICL
ncbi:MAG: aminopeptidase P family protein [Oscillospiraceae bacterium]|nr:aminopeptidase P family protein [Oscillospiraceae bacterium]